MSKSELSKARWASTCIVALIAACGAETGMTPSPTGEAGTTAVNTPARAGTGGTVAGTQAVAAGRGGTVATGNTAAAGTAGTAATSSNAGAGGTSAINVAGTGGAGTAAMSSSAGSGGAGASGAAGQAGAPAAGSGGTGGTGGGGGEGGSRAEPPKGGALQETIVVGAGETFDGKGQRYTAGSALGDGSQSEDQQPLFKLEDGATLENVVLGGPAADGIHCHGNATLRNIVWEDIGEDALTIKGKGTVKLDGGSAKNGDDKVFQINEESRFEISNFKASNAGKFIRQNGGTDFKVEVVIDRCDISNMDEAIFRTDSKTSTVEMTNTRYSKIGDELFIGVSAGNIKQMNNTEY